MTPSEFILVTYKPHFQYSSQAGSPAPFLSAFKSQLYINLMNKLTLCLELLVGLTLRRTESAPFVLATALLHFKQKLFVQSHKVRDHI